MGHRIMNKEDKFIGLEYDTLEEAENALKYCPSGYWVDTWYLSHMEDMKRKIIYNSEQNQSHN